MHAASVTNVLRGDALRGVEMRDPAKVAAYLNTMFQMHTHGGMFLTLWYGVYDLETRTLDYCSAGHHPAFLVTPGSREAQSLRVPNVALGVAPGLSYSEAAAEVPPGSALYVFSDGVFEIELADGSQWSLEDFAAQLVAPRQPGVPETQRLRAAAHAVAKSPAFDDDFSMVVVTFA